MTTNLGALDTPANTAARVLSILPRLKRDRARYAQIYGPEMVEKAAALEILLTGFAAPQVLTEDTPQKRQALTAQLKADPELMERLTPLLFDASPFRQVLTEELDEIERLREVRNGMEASPLPCDVMPPEQRAADAKLTGLAFSGGGIRSATFNLGVLQALAERKVLRQIDYLSTVSGGGYIGSWLAAWIQTVGVHKVEKALSPADSPYPQQDEVRPIEFLRDYSNYLAPKPGMFSADTWTILSVWARNTFLNMLILIGSLSAFLLLPRALGYAADYLLQIHAETSGPEPLHPILLAAIVLLAPAVVFIALNLANFNRPDGDRPVWWKRQGGVLMTVVLPTALACFVGAMAMWSMVRYDFEFNWWQTSLELLPASLTVGFLLVLMEHVGDFYACFVREGARPVMAMLALATWPVLAAVAGLGLRTAVARLLYGWTDIGSEAFWRVVVLGPPLLLAVFIITLVLHIGLMGRSFPDDRREWLSRLAAWMAIVTAGGTALCMLAFYGPWALAKVVAWGQAAAGAGVLLGWVGTTVSGILASREKRTPANANDAPPPPGLFRRTIVAAAPYVFIGGLLIGLSSLLTIGLGVSACDTQSGQNLAFCKQWSGDDGLPSVQDLGRDFWGLLSLTNAWWVLGAVLASAAIAMLFSYTVDVNEFSMHHFYKNRLVRCFLGACRGTQRHVNPFTGFDNSDDRALASFRHDHPAGGYSGPYPIINATLNLVRGERLSWQERKGMSFIFTPKYCGFANGITEELAIDPEQEFAPNPRGSRFDLPAYRPTDVYAYPVQGIQVGGPKIGTAMAISGAAATPNMGYQSSAPLAFLMTVFNVRLGWWLGNPLLDRWRNSGPPFGLHYLLAELFGLTNLERKYIYLSDGGHFENLALYELVRRRCSLIISGDAEQDGTMSFGGLGNAIRKCRTDFGVEIEIDPLPIRKRLETGFSDVQFVTGRIVYPERDPATGDQRTGVLVYLKSSMTGEEPPDLLEYKRRQPEFPHQSTGDQFFDESQFESYRTLGYLIAKRALAGGLERMLSGEAKVAAAATAAQA